MPESRSRAGIIAAVRAPLGLFALIALVAEGLLLAGAPPWVPGLLLALLIVAVIVLASRSPGVLAIGADAYRVTVSITFQDVEPWGIDLDEDVCSIEIRDGDNRTKMNRRPVVRLGPGGWAVDLIDLRPNDSVRMTLMERDGTAWRVHPFRPFESTQTANVVEAR